MAAIDKILAGVDGGLEASRQRLFELLRFPSVGTDPAHAGDCRAAALWLAEYLEGLGFGASLRATTGQPVVIGTYAPAGLPPSAPHVLFYGHYDVQPADPLDLWESPPFEPCTRNDKEGNAAIFARGANDDKGQLLTFLEACRAHLAEAALPFRLTVLIEGDEEGDSGHLDAFLAAHRHDLKADVAFICDTGLWDAKTPAINTMLRGCIAEEVRITGPRVDLHSGYYGGPAVNPIKVLSRILGALHGKTGKVAIPGFYDGVKPPSAALRRQWASLGFRPRQFLKEVGLSIPAGERNFTPLETMWARPTAEVNGIWGGYRGSGFKTVLPAEASAKLTFRLVEGQKPERVRRAFRRFVTERLPKDCRAGFLSQGGDSTGISVKLEPRWLDAAKRALKAEWRKAAVEIGTGGSIPVVESFRRHLGIESLMIGFTLDDDAAHSPNEKYGLENFRKGIRSWARLFAELS